MTTRAKRSPNLTPTDVELAFLKLRETNTPVTIRNLQQEIGHGSLSTVTKLAEELGIQMEGNTYHRSDKALAFRVLRLEAQVTRLTDLVDKLRRNQS